MGTLAWGRLAEAGKGSDWPGGILTNSKHTPLPATCLPEKPRLRTEAGQLSFADFFLRTKSLKKFAGFLVLSFCFGFALLWARIAASTWVRVTTGLVRGLLVPCQRFSNGASMMAVFFDLGMGVMRIPPGRDSG